MISVKEVMKGCILSYEGRAQVVKGISEYIIFEGKKEWIGGSLINGEPISEAWLDRLGFKLTGQHGIWGNEKISIVLLSDGTFSMNGCLIFNRYIHQLQVLIFAMTGEHLKLPKLK
jgi:hypothetical protein